MKHANFQCEHERWNKATNEETRANVKANKAANEETRSNVKANKAANEETRSNMNDETR